MYRLALYFLIFLCLAALALSFFGLLPFKPYDFLFSTALILAVCIFVNTIFAKVFEVPTNVESEYITALILVLIITPPQVSNYSAYFIFAGWASLWAMASKYIFAIGKKHLFNPAAFAVALTSFSIAQSASWWVGTASMLPLVVIGGLLVVRKIKRFNMVLSFLLMGLATITVTSFLRLGSGSAITLVQRVLVDSPILFFSFIMITEPLTTPPTKKLQIFYGALVGLLFAPVIHVGSIYSTPELALLAGNIFSYLVSPKERLVLELKEKIPIGSDICDFVFASNRKLAFRPGQYLEWTLGNSNADSRGNRRYFTVASSPTEKNIRIGVKFYSKPSSFKKSMLSMNPGDKIIASQLAGDFTLPGSQKKKLVFIAGGIGITPFRSMLKYLLDSNQPRSIVLFYSNSLISEIAYKDIFDLAEKELGVKTVYNLTNINQIPAEWQGGRGHISKEMIIQEIPDYKERLFYISGSRSMVVAFEKILKDIAVPNNNIKVDFFPGFA